LRVQCTVSGAAEALPVSINQCNDSAIAGGETVTCMASVTNNFISPPPPPTTTATTTPLAGLTTGTGSGSGGSGSSGSGSGGTGSVTAATIPLGAPQTGEGGASRSGDNVPMVVLGGLALIGAAAATGQALRRRRILSLGDTTLDGDE